MALDGELRVLQIVSKEQRWTALEGVQPAITDVELAIRPRTPCPAWRNLNDAARDADNQARVAYLDLEQRAQYQAEHEAILAELDSAIRDYLVEALHGSARVQPINETDRVILARQLDELLTEAKSLARPYYEVHPFGVQLLDILVSREKDMFETELIRTKGGLAGVATPGWRCMTDDEVRLVHTLMMDQASDSGRKRMDLSYLTGDPKYDLDLFMDRMEPGDDLITEIAGAAIYPVLVRMSNTQDLIESLERRVPGLKALAERHEEIDSRWFHEAECHRQKEWLAKAQLDLMMPQPRSEERTSQRQVGTTADKAERNRDGMEGERNRTTGLSTSGKTGAVKVFVCVGMLLLIIWIVVRRRG